MSLVPACDCGKRGRASLCWGPNIPNLKCFQNVKVENSPIRQKKKRRNVETVDIRSVTFLLRGVRALLESEREFAGDGLFLFVLLLLSLEPLGLLL